MQFLFENLIFDIPKILQKHYLAQHDTICVFKNTPKHCKNGGKQWKNLDQFLTLSLDQFLTLKPPNFGPILTLQHIYIFILFLF